MANKRIFSVDVVCTDKFIEMPVSSQALYFQLGMKADDDGFISAPKQIVRMVNASADDLRILASKGFIIPYDDGVIVIKHWRVNNSLRKDRYKATRHLDKKEVLQIVNDEYFLKDGLPNDNQVTTICQPHGYARLGKDSIGKYNNINIICPEPQAQDRQIVINLTLNDNTEYPIYQNDVDDWSGLYPAVDVLQELRKMKGWLDANPTKRKTRRGIKRFVNGWLSKEQDKGYRQQSTPQIKHNSFNNFEGRRYDMRSLEQQLLTSQKGEKT